MAFDSAISIDPLALEAGHHLAEPARQGRREALEGLIKQEQAAARHQGAAERHQFLSLWHMKLSNRRPKSSYARPATR